MIQRFLPALTLLAAGCAPNVRLAATPEIVSSQWRGGTLQSPAPTTLPAGPSERLADSLGSAELQRLTDRALYANADLSAAVARIERARSALHSARAAMLPVVSASAGASETRTDDKNNSLFRFSEGFAGLDIGYDLDLSGTARANSRAARERVLAARSDREALVLVVEADVARSYVQYCTLGERIRLLDASIADARELERVITLRFREGAATRVDVGLQAVAARQLETDRSRLLEASQRTRDALALLTGAEAPIFAVDGTELSRLVVPTPATVQPGDLLVRRPDIRAAEARIEAAAGDVVAARRAFLPGLHLSASLLGQAARLTGPLGSTLSAGAGLLAPIFDRSRLNGRLSFAAADQHESVELYRKALLNALKEGEDALAGVERSAERARLIEDILANAETTARLSRRQYLEGDVDLRTVLDAQHLLIQAQDARAIALEERLDAAADLYAAMGGQPSREVGPLQRTANR